MNALEFKKYNDCEIFDETNIDYSDISDKLEKEIKKSKKIIIKIKREKKISLNDLINDIIKRSDV